MQEYKLTVIDKFGEKREHVCNKFEWDGYLLTIYKCKATLIEASVIKAANAELIALYREFNSFEIEEVEDESES